MQDNAVWPIPLRIVSAGYEPAREILRTREADIELPEGHEQWWKINADQAGFFRVLYSESMIPKIGAAILNKEISVKDRVGIINDAFALAFAGYCSTVTALELLPYYKNEDSPIVLADIVANLGQLASVLYKEDKDTKDRLRNFRRDLLAPIAAELGFDARENDGHLTKLLRSLVIQATGTAQVTEVVEVCQKRFAAYAAGDKAAIHPDLLLPVLQTVLANGGEEEFDAFIKIYDEAQTDDIKVTVLQAIGSCKSEALAERALNLNFTDRVRAQDVYVVLLSCASNHVGREATWKYCQDKWDVLYEQFASGSFLMGRIVPTCTSRFVTEEDAARVEAFFTTKDINEAVKRSISQATETIRANASFVTRDSAAIKAWLEAKVEL